MDNKNKQNLDVESGKTSSESQVRAKPASNFNFKYNVSTPSSSSWQNKNENHSPATKSKTSTTNKVENNAQPVNMKQEQDHDKHVAVENSVSSGAEMQKTDSNKVPVSENVTNRDVNNSNDEDLKAIKKAAVSKDAIYSEQQTQAKQNTLLTSEKTAALHETEQPQVINSRSPERGYKANIVFGFLILILGFGGFGAWATLAPIKSGAMAGGEIKLAGERKTIQHLEGGIIKELLVKEGDFVEKGQVILRLEGAQAKALLENQQSEYYSLIAREARLKAVRDGSETIQFPKLILDMRQEPDIQELMQREINLFEASRTQLHDQLKVLSQWIDQSKEEIKGLEFQKRAAEFQLTQLKEEILAAEDLFKEGYYEKTKLQKLKSDAAGLKGKIGELETYVARAQQKITETDLRAITLKDQQVQGAVSELSALHSSVLKTGEKMQAAKDIVERLDVVSPRSGRIVTLHYHTPGGVITPSSPILDLVPDDEKLVVKAKINPIDIDVVFPGTQALVQLMAYSMRTTPPLPGTVLQVSADRLDDLAKGESYYYADVEVDKDALSNLADVKLYPGMPVSVQVVTGERTFLDYIISPIETGLRRALLEE
ncbi:MAG: HlyD family type I secretion periplasmic adaptor subunit [Gammaproteobacteria bacterium]|nr:HlyD family type I secretion periplasmic adaptor subunit [Gammaproteobacteria bacterium]